jgi:hypothetical protein
VNGAFALTVNTTGTGTTRFNGQVGNVTPLAALTTNADGTTVFNAAPTSPSVETTGDQTYDDEVVLEDDTALLATDGNIAFGDDVTATGPSIDLSIEVGSDGDIVFEKDPVDGDQIVDVTGNLDFDTNRDGAPPLDATIYKSTPGAALILRAGENVTVATHDKISVPDDVFMEGEIVTIGDLNALNVEITADQLVFLGRAFAAVELQDGSTTFDRGVGVIANTITFVTSSIDVPQTPNAGVVIGTPTGGQAGEMSGNIRPEDGFILRAIFDGTNRQLVAEDFFSLVNGSDGNPVASPPPDPFTDGNVLDLVARGPGFGNLDIVPYVPPEEEKNPSAISNKNALSERPLREDEVENWLACLETDAGFACEAEIVGTERAASVDAQKVKGYVQNMFGETREEQTRRVLESAVEAYKTQTSAAVVAGAEFRRFVESSPEFSEALTLLNDLGDMFLGIQALGTTDEAYKVVRTNRLSKVAPTGISLEELDAAVQAGITAWPTEPSTRIAASDRFYLFQGLETSRIYLFERVEGSR